MEPLHIIVCINNYVRFKRRYELFWKFKENIEKHKNTILYIVEIAFGEREFQVTDKTNPNHLQLRTEDELWHKENSINLMVQRLPKDWKYVAWIDGDISFLNENFAEETIHQLQHYKIVQLFQSVVNLGPNGEVISTFKGFGFRFCSGDEYPMNMKYEIWHPGFAWACTKQAWNDMGGLIDFAILGAGDHHMALSWIGKGAQSLPGGISDEYKKMVLLYQERCEKHIRRDIGYVPGTIIHNWHGDFKNRKYQERWEILVKGKYNPEKDIKRDWQGLYMIDNIENIELRDGIRRYFRQRNEDSIDIY